MQPHHSVWIHAIVHAMEAIQQAGWLGLLLFIGLYAAACLCFIPGSILTLAAGAVYGFWEGTLLVLAGNGLGALLSLLITRYLLRDWAKKQFAKNPRMRAIEEAVAHDGWRIVLLTRLSPIMPYSLINYSLGLTRLSATRFLLATELGAIPSTCIYVYIGTLIGDLAKIGPDLRHHRPLEWTIQGAGLVLTIMITIYVTHIASQSLKKRMRGGHSARG
jgi:uncharacterized membrane protein YdjX (TVP38/TMEM64 family)